MKNLIVSLFTIFMLQYVYAQDKNDIAIALFQKAETAFNQKDFEDAYKLLVQAELNLGATNTKLLYLKVKALNNLISTNSSYVTVMKQALDAFFARVDKATYPQEKYNELVLMSVDLQSRLLEEDDAFEKIKNSNKISELEAFSKKYPKSKYETELKAKYNKLLDAENKKREEERLKLSFCYQSVANPCDAPRENETFTAEHGGPEVVCVISGLIEANSLTIWVVDNHGKYNKYIPVTGYNRKAGVNCVTQLIEVTKKDTYNVMVYSDFKSPDPQSVKLGWGFGAKVHNGNNSPVPILAGQIIVE